ncbi:transporter substrate-binding domain-containing protein [Marinobacter caseinilyticus]|uniref:transporter substrate-binding domain-containing protein n=1 Tax=Marinobacter caseinilyticus TaxID=2692195 RepID=UPI00140DD218|nr:transporter substrate-binding domain-containing protein [Marinobacter caseinilyticus]
MDLRFYAALVASLLLAPAHAQTLDLYTFHAPPYQINPDHLMANYAVSGTTVNTIECAAKAMGWTIRVKVVPQNRAVLSLRNHAVDGYFAVDESPILNQFAKLSSPIALEKWYLFSVQPIRDLMDARIGVIAGSNEANWLHAIHQSRLLQVTSIKQLLQLLLRGRVDAIMMDWRTMQFHVSDMIPEQQTQLRTLATEFVRFAPLSLYLDNHFVDRHPDFLPTFNANLSGCVSVDFQLSEQEETTVQALANTLLADLQDTVDIAANLAMSQTDMPLSEILSLDSRWQATAPDNASVLAEALLERPTSGDLRAWQDTTGGLVTEVFAMNAQGAITALSRLTSDYWQGDEEKFQATLALAPSDLVMSPLSYDASVRGFQVTASAPVHDQRGRFLGAIAIGIDIERALRKVNGVFSSFLSEPPDRSPK